MPVDLLVWRYLKSPPGLGGKPFSIHAVDLGLVLRTPMMRPSFFATLWNTTKCLGVMPPSRLASAPATADPTDFARRPAALKRKEVNAATPMAAMNRARYWAAGSRSSEVVAVAVSLTAWKRSEAA